MLVKLQRPLPVESSLRPTRGCASSTAVRQPARASDTPAARPDAELTDDERRRLYTACSRALHAATLLADKEMLKKLGIVL